MPPDSPSQRLPGQLYRPASAPSVSPQSALAAIAAAGGDITPAYKLFRKHAVFVPELGDFALTPAAFKILAFQTGFGACGGVGLGDQHILFNATATKGHLTYDGLSALCRVVATRLPAYARSHLDPFAILTSPSRSASPDLTPPSFGEVPARSSSPHRLASTARAAVTISALKAAAAPKSPPRPGTQAAARVNAGASPTRAAEAPAALPAEGLRGLGGLMVVRDPPVILREMLPLPRCDHPHLASTVAGIRVMYNGGEVRRAFGTLLQLERDWEQAAEDNSFKVPRASKPKPELPGGPRPSSTGGPQQPLAPPVPQAAPPGGGRAPHTPLEGAVWLLIMGGCCLMAEGKYDAAHQRMRKAESIFNTALMGVDHPLLYSVHMVHGLLLYYRQEYEQALERFETARELSDMVARNTNSMEARKNAAVCSNNKGVCFTLLCRHSEAMLAYRSAVDLLRNGSGLDVPEAGAALANLNRALKYSFSVDTRLLHRPSSAPAGAGGALAAFRRNSAAASFANELTKNAPYEGPQVAGSNERLVRFLRQAITVPPSKPPSALPIFATRSKGEGKMASKKKPAAAAAKKKDGKKGPPKPPAFDARVAWPFPSYGVANVKLPAKKKKKAPVVDAPPPH